MISKRNKMTRKIFINYNINQMSVIYKLVAHPVENVDTTKENDQRDKFLLIRVEIFQRKLKKFICYKNIFYFLLQSISISRLTADNYFCYSVRANVFLSVKHFNTNKNSNSLNMRDMVKDPNAKKITLEGVLGALLA